ncbi:bifunctional proline dehydrogenase/L-glutamate gamma-semialdehyde dehydrogenase PutA [Povalibacter sp.]|uniref:bifunctional proline dehydrogenase/L-glutamate gamma-semialdehyde dehydrogenase PutA n=1 Tax=Povalibacter sp. TaxID=1962978 RepID=UPI002F3F5FBF
MEMPAFRALAAERTAIRSLYYASETTVIRNLLARYGTSPDERARIASIARRFVDRARERRSERGLLETFLQEFGLSTDEGIALLGLAEALLRVPDSATADNLIAEKVRSGSWAKHDSQSDSALVNAATRALMLAGSIVQLDGELGGERGGLLRSMVHRLGEPIVRTAVRQAMRIMGGEFVLGRTIDEAVSRAASDGEIASFDMLGEGARTAADARRHFESYLHCIDATGRAVKGDLHAKHNVSVKLSALHPRYEFAQKQRVLQELLPRLTTLAIAARDHDVGMTIDAEEASRLDLSLDLIEALARDPVLGAWQGLGLAVQCYSKRTPAVIDWLIALGHETGRRFMVRLVKGAYWDTEIKRAQETGVRDYPVFTRKVNTDLAYLACARQVLAHPDVIYPQFATHNAHTVAAVLEMAGRRRDFEFQRLHGMGELLYAAAREVVPDLPQVRIYAPVGAHKELLAYLVRRLLENGANSSFVNRFMDERVSPEQLIEDPAHKVSVMTSIPNPHIPLPAELYGASRRNSLGLDLSDPLEVQSLQAALVALRGEMRAATPIVCGAPIIGPRETVTNPADRNEPVGHVVEATADDVGRAVAAAAKAQPAWDRRGADERAAILERAADAFEAGRELLISLLVREAGKTLVDAIAEVREAVDFCRYYAAQARIQFGAPRQLPGPTGEQNLYSLHGRGAFVCISPWNFPLAIFTGQVVAALAAGNTVLAKPAEQTPLIAARAVELLHQAGVPVDALHLLPGRGEVVGAALVADERIAGVVMTGSTATAKLIARTLAMREGPIVPLIAETGGQNAMFVDSTALPEQVVDDVIRSAFHSAGQRCSALRVLYLQEEVADGIIAMIRGAMDQLKIGHPADLATDVGPVIDAQARDQLLAHAQQLHDVGHQLHAVKLSDACASGTFVAPHLFLLDSVTELKQEHFGPLLHVIRYRQPDLQRHLDELHATGFGLTLGVHTRIDAVARNIFDASLAGNVYVNRNMIGAVVGVQPFGGHGLSGTGPKAGGPLYLQRFATERTLTINTAATGGNVALLRMQADD